MEKRVGRLLLMTMILSSAASWARADDWPQWLGPRRDSVWRESGTLDRFPAGGPNVLWRSPIGAGYSGPAVVANRVYVTDRVIQEGAQNPGNPFVRASIPGVERVLCLNAADGSVVWKDQYPCPYTISYAAGPRATPAVADGKVYTVGAQGDLRCLDAQNGKLLWSAKLGAPDGSAAPMWGFAGSPLVDGNKLICMADGKDAVAIAFDKNDGRVLWKALHAKEPGYSSPIICQAGGVRQLIVWYPDALASLNPETGETYWREPFEIKVGLDIATPRCAGDLLLVSAFYDGSLMMRLDHDKPAATKLWQRKGKNEQHSNVLQALMCTPFIRDGYVYGVSSYGQLRCVKADTGDPVWETFAATSGDAGPVRWSNAFLIANQDRFFIPNEHGELIIAKLRPKGYEELSRAHLIEPTNHDAQRAVVWSHPALANRCIYLRNDKEIACVSLAADAR